MAFEDILREVDQLHGVGTRLGALAEQTPAMTKELLAISGNVHGIATLLEVLVVSKEQKRPEQDTAK
jgi:hypothetical protein